MQSIFDILHKNFQEDQLNSRRFPGFSGVVDTLCSMPCQDFDETALDPYGSYVVVAHV